MKTLSCIFLLLTHLVLPEVLAAPTTALDRYVAKPDNNFHFYAYHTERKPLYTTYFLRMQSQQWRSREQVSRSIWEHDVSITVPRKLTAKQRKTAVLMIDGGLNGQPPPKNTDAKVATLAVISGTPVVLLKQIPNQPVVFADEKPFSRTEDAIIAYTFDQFLKNPADEEWPLQLPMTKAVVRAMDMAQAALATKSIRIDQFILSGGSKRAWTAWLTAAVDARVKAIAPASFDFLNLPTQVRHECETFGFYPKAIEDYAALDLMNQTQTPAGIALASIVDPYAYRSRYTLPKFILNAAGDQYFPPDASQFYFGNLPAQKWLRYSPNADHAQNNNAFLSAVAWARRVLYGRSLPQFSWTYDSLSGTLEVKSLEKPLQARLWRAQNLYSRDFRLESIGKTWSNTPLYDLGGGQYSGRVSPPATGWSAFFVELTYRSSEIPVLDQVYTTDVFVTPNTVPYVSKNCFAE